MGSSSQILDTLSIVRHQWTTVVSPLVQQNLASVGRAEAGGAVAEYFDEAVAVRLADAVVEAPCRGTLANSIIEAGLALR